MDLILQTSEGGRCYHYVIGRTGKASCRGSSDLCTSSQLGSGWAGYTHGLWTSAPTLATTTLPAFPERRLCFSQGNGRVMRRNRRLRGGLLGVVSEGGQLVCRGCEVSSPPSICPALLISTSPCGLRPNREGLTMNPLLSSR